MDFDMEKFKMVVHYIIYKCGFKNTVGRTVIHKLLYFSDFNYYELHKESITNEEYKELERGPVPIHFELAIKELVDENKVGLGQRKLPCGKIMNRYFSLKSPEITLKNEERALINKVIKELSHMNGKQIGEYSLRDVPARKTQYADIIDYDLVFLRKPKEQDKVVVKIN